MRFEQLDARDHAVLSVGDLAFPHRLSVDEIGEHALMRVPGHGALEAVFQQPALHAREDDDRPTVAELQHEAAIEMGRRMVERPATFEQTIADARATIDSRLAVDADVRTLVGPFTTGSAVPTPEGVLLVHHALDIYSDDAQTLEQGIGDTMRFEWLDDAALARLRERGELSTTRCPSLARGSVEMSLAPRIEAAVDGSALAISMREQPTTIWRKLPQPGCAWIEIGTIESPSLLDRRVEVLAPRLPPGPEGSARSLMAEFGIDDVERASVRLWLTPVEEPLELLRLPDGVVDTVAFIDDLHLVALARVPVGIEEPAPGWEYDQALYLLDRRRPGAHLRIPIDFFAETRRVRELAVVGPAVEGEHGPRLAVTLVDDGVDTELAILTIGAAAWQRFVDGEADPVELFTLTPEELELRGLGRALAIASLAVSPTALVHALADGTTPAEITVHRIDGGPERRLTNNDLVDTLPHFTADGRAVVFVTGVRSSLSSTPFSVPRIAWLD